MNESLPIIIVGGGGHACVVLDCLLQLKKTVLGYLSPQKTRYSALKPYKHIGDDDALQHFSPSKVNLVLGIGSVKNNQQRKHVYDRHRGSGFNFVNLIHPSAVVSQLEVNLGHGVQILNSAVVNTGVSIADNVIINSNALIEHHCKIESHVHIASAACLCGSCTIRHGTFVGAASVVKQGITIESCATIAAGAVVVNDVPAETILLGVAARPQDHK